MDTSIGFHLLSSSSRLLAVPVDTCCIFHWLSLLSPIGSFFAVAVVGNSSDSFVDLAIAEMLFLGGSTTTECPANDTVLPSSLLRLLELFSC